MTIDSKPGPRRSAHDEFALLVQDENPTATTVACPPAQNARLRQPEACLEDVNYKHPRGLQKQLFLELANPRWLPAGRNVLLTGPTGIGKSWLACALGNAARQDSPFFPSAPPGSSRSSNSHAPTVPVSSSSPSLPRPSS
ncbi:MAG: ATP-binding protein [Elusimicrobia bacterium]|nr:ATP-binding protein [Elusimicrobiota bacterium]